MKRQKRSGILLVWLILMLAAGGIVISGRGLWEIRQVCKEGEQSYTRLAQQVRKGTIDFAALQAINPDTAAWLYCPDTGLDYPVMQAREYDYYLHYLPDGSYNSSGSLFLDYNHPADFSGRLNIVYGHNMSSGSMLGSLTGYREQRYFEEHPYLYLYTAGNSRYRIDLLYGCVVEAGQWRERAFMFEENLPALLAYAADNSTFVSGVAVTDQDRIVVLSACSGGVDDTSYIVIGVLREE